MANTNAQAISFSNTRIRPMSDLLYSTYLSAKKLTAEWNAQSVATVIPNDSTIIADGSATDGRPQITDAQATNIVTRCNEIITWYEGTGTLSATTGRDTTILAVEVNGRAAF